MEKGVIQRIGRGTYRLGKQKEFIPSLSKEHKSIYKKLKEEYPYLDVCIWSTKWLVEWMLHIPGNYETIIEVEKGAEESIFYYLSPDRENVFLNPTQDLLNRYAKDSNEVVIVKNLVTDAPLQMVDDVQIPALEKILVDLIVNTGPFYAFQGRDLESIVENAFENNTINMDKLLRYASRRRKREFVETQIKQILNP